MKDPFLRLEVRYVPPLEKHPSLAKAEHAEDGFHRRRLAGPVRPDDYGDFSGLHADRATVKDIGASVPADHFLADKEAHDALPARVRFFRPVPR